MAGSVKKSIRFGRLYKLVQKSFPSDLVSGKSRALLPPSPLRTVHESFPSYGSSNSIFLFVVRNRLILSTFSFISLVAVVVDKLPYNRTINRYFVDVPCFCTIYFLAT